MELAQELSERVQAGRLSDVTITYRVAGGMPSERLEEELRVDGSGRVDGRLHDALADQHAREGTAELDPLEQEGLLRDLASDLDHLARQNVRFVPDSLVGSITAEIGERSSTYYFRPPEAGKGTGEPPQEPRPGLERLREVSDALLVRDRS